MSRTIIFPEPLPRSAWAALALVALWAGLAHAAERPVSYVREIKPLLANRCYACHGPDADERQADLRLDVRDGALSAIEPGDPAASTLIERIAEADPDLRMPPADSNKPPLTADEVELVRRWIAEGAKFDQHWAYVAPQRPAVPEAPDPAWVKNPIDAFVAAGHAAHDLKPAAEADPRTLARRLSFDLAGLPPAPEEVDTFAADPSPAAYEQTVERLLASPHFGERMAVYWLDVARYGDTGGYHSDNHRDVWLYRDYVIQAFNEGKPFDQFVTEQLAGDLLPEATRWQRIASGYNRLLQTTEEGGAQPKEYQAKYDADRVRNTGSAFLAATTGCAECHDHKFDPYTTRDFYSFAALFADIQEKSVGRQEQTKLPLPEQEAQVAKLDGEIATVRTALETSTTELAAAQVAWERSLQGRKIVWTPLVPQTAVSAEGHALKVEADGAIYPESKEIEKDTFTLTAKLDRTGVTGFRLDVLPDPALPEGGPGLGRDGDFGLMEFEVKAGGKKVLLAGATASHAQDRWPAADAIDGKVETGWAILPQTGKPNHAVFETAADLDAGENVSIELKQSYGSRYVLGRFRLSATTDVRPIHAEGATSLPADVAAALAVPSDKRDEPQQNVVAAYYRKIAPALHSTRKRLADLERDRQTLLDSLPTSLVSISGKPREIRILPRGNWLDDSGEVVEPAIPAFLGKLETGDHRATRLDLAQWMTARDNPLVARVFVNRLWKLMFGQGLVRTADDFGAQGAAASHPELLDWLAVEFIESGWNVKHIVQLMATSAAYRQASTADPQIEAADPTNQWLARQGRFRLDAEFVRDNALAVSGLLTDKIGGPSVKPYQPAGYWAHLNFPLREYEPDHGENQYRRGLYTYWQRTFLHPSLLAFDASTREECTADRPRSNTPLQALVLLNDPTYVEAARVLAARTLQEAGPTEPEGLRQAFRRVLNREPAPAEAEVLSALYHKHYEEYARDEAAAKALLSEGDQPAPADVPPAELAAWTSVTRAILNLHETVTRY